VPDVPAASAFYADVLGWSVSEPDDQFGGYVIAHVDGAAAAGIGPQQAPGPVAWTVYFASDDADATAAAVGVAGGHILLPPGDVGPLGRMFIAADPTGAVFGVWQAGVHIGAGVVNEPGGITWEDLRTDNPDLARSFYAQVFGFSYAPMAGAPQSYQIFTRGSDPADEMRPMGGIGPHMSPAGSPPPHWLVYFAVPDADEAAERAIAKGGTVPVPGLDTPFGRMIGIVDPFGAHFWVAATPASA
jgi:hypothetical protein